METFKEVEKRGEKDHMHIC